MFYKVGCSENTKRRLRSINTDCPFVVEIFREYDCDPVMEKVIHEKFQDKKIKGEWFVFNDSDFEKIGEIISNQDEIINNPNESGYEILKKRKILKDSLEIKAYRKALRLMFDEKFSIGGCGKISQKELKLAQSFMSKRFPKTTK